MNMNDCEKNSIETNDIKTNDIKTNDIKTNDMKTNGMETNGMETNGMDINGMEINDMEINDMEITGRKKRKSALHVIIIVLLVVPLIGFGSYYIYMANYYETHFLSGFVINGKNYSQCTVAQVESSLARNAEAFSITLYERDGKKEVISAEDIGYHYVSNGMVQKLLEQQNPYSWIISSLYFNDFYVNVGADYSDDKLKQCIDSLDCTSGDAVIPPKNAFVKYTDNNRYEIIPEVMGTTLDKEKLYNEIKSAIENNENVINLEDENLYINPKVTEKSKKLRRFAKKLNKLTSAKITYDFGDRKEIIDRKVLKEWLVINKKKKTVHMDYSHVCEYVKELADKYDTYGKPRKFTDHLGKTIEVEGGNYGWLINQEAESEKLLSLIKKGRKTKRSPEYTYTAVSRKTSDIGNTYVEVDLTNQHLWYYINGKLYYETDLVSGDVLRGRETPTGTYTIVACAQHAVLVGPGYRTPVNYWMPFYGGCGLHDAVWRWSFGGEIYNTNGSHGCLNLSLEAARTIYEKMEVGTPIVIYKGIKAA